MGYKSYINHQKHCQKDSRNHTSHEKLSDGCSGKHGINNHRNTWREDRSDRSGCRCDGTAEFRVIALFFHLLDFHQADTGSICNGRSGHTGENQGNKYVNLCSTAF